MDYFKNACRIHTALMIGRYLMSIAEGRWDSAEKAMRHRELCQFYVAAVHGLNDPEAVHLSHDDAYHALHEATQALTDNLDDEIGFPLEGLPDYDALEPLFFERFHELAMAALLPASSSEPYRES